MKIKLSPLQEKMIRLFPKYSGISYRSLKKKFPVDMVKVSTIDSLEKMGLIKGTEHHQGSPYSRPYRLTQAGRDYIKPSEGEVKCKTE